MMSLLWYYRPEHTPYAHSQNYIRGEIYASRHRDISHVACIDDKCYVLTYNEFCRYKRYKSKNQLALSQLQGDRSAMTVPPPPVSLLTSHTRFPPSNIASELVFCCRKVFDYRQRRVLKNPSVNTLATGSATIGSN